MAARTFRLEQAPLGPPASVGAVADSDDSLVPHALATHALAQAQLRVARAAAADGGQKAEVRLLERAHLSAAASAAPQAASCGVGGGRPAAAGRGGAATAAAETPAAAAAAKALAMQRYAAVRCAGRWGELLAALREAERAVPAAAAALARARAAADASVAHVLALQSLEAARSVRRPG